MKKLLLLALAGCAPGVSDYNAGCRAMDAKNYDEARRLFEKSVAANAEFAEAWYRLCAAKEQQARKAAADRKDDEAVKTFQSSVEDLRKAKALMDQGKFVGTDPAERGPVVQRVAKELQDREDALKRPDAEIADWIRSLTGG